MCLEGPNNKAMIDWQSFLGSHNIPFKSTGNNIEIPCPWCGGSDPSHHMAISLAGRGFKCWRDRTHAGRHPAKLIQALLGCSWEQANGYAGTEKSIPNDFLSKIRGTLMQADTVETQYKLDFPSEFKTFSGLPSSKPYTNYLMGRGFSELQIRRASAEYGIRYASQGDYKGRVIFPVWFEDQLVGWTGRTIYPNEDLRYKTLSNNPEKGPPTAPRPISDYLLFFDVIKQSKAKYLVICEGPFDALKVNILGTKLGVVSTCLFTNSASKAQLGLLHELIPQFEKSFVLLDFAAAAQAGRLVSQLAALNVQGRGLPDGYKDPGELGSIDVLRFCLRL